MSILKLSPKHKRNILRILPFGLFWGAFGLIYSILEKGLLGNLEFYPSTGNAYDSFAAFTITPVVSAIMGWMLGAAEIYYFLNSNILLLILLNIKYKISLRLCG
jgi:hypothetical protein